MKISTVAEAKSSPVGTILECVHGTLTKLFKPSTGEGAYGHYSLQNGEIESNGDFMKIVFKNRDELQSDRRGQKITVTSSTKKGLNGIKVHENNHKGVKTIELLITPSAHIDFGIIPEVGSAPVKPTTPAPASKPQASAPASPAPELPKPSHGVDKVRSRLMQMANLYKSCLDASRWIVEANNLSGEDVRACATALYIQGTRENLHSEMPNHPLNVKSAPEPVSAPKSAIPSEDLKEDASWEAEDSTQAEPPPQIDQTNDGTNWRKFKVPVGPHTGMLMGAMEVDDITAYYNTFKANPKVAEQVYFRQALLLWFKETNS